MMTAKRKALESGLLDALDSRELRCGVIGLGFIGSTLMDALRMTGLEVHGYDRSVSAVERYRRRTLEGAGQARWSVKADPLHVIDADVVVVAVRAPVQADGAVDLEPLRSAAKLLADHPRSPRLIIVESTVPPGTTRRFARWCASDAAGSFVAHSPERLSVGHDWKVLKHTAHLLGGLDPFATRVGSRFLGQICDEVVSVSAPEVSELSKLLENAFISVGVALVGEMTRIAHAFNVSATEVTEAAATKAFGYHAFHPGPGIGGHCLPNDLRMLLEAARSRAGPLDLLEATASVTQALPRTVVDRLESVLAEASLSLKDAEVLLVGVGFKIGSADTTATPALAVVRELRRRGARPSYCDSRVEGFDVDGQAVPRIDNERLRALEFAAAVVLAGDPAVSANDLQDASQQILDAGGARLLRGRLDRAHRL